MAATLLIQQQQVRRVQIVGAAEPSQRSRFNAEAPTVFQTGPWQCSAASTAWVLQSMGYSHSQDDVVALLGPGEIDPAVGLHNGDGRALVQLLRNVGLTANNAAVSFDDVLQMAGRRPVAMGGAAFYHRLEGSTADSRPFGVFSTGTIRRGLGRGIRSNVRSGLRSDSSGDCRVHSV